MHRISIRTWGISIAATTLAALSLGAAPAHAASSLTASPSSGLANNQSISVSGSGFTAGASVAVLQCATIAADQAAQQAACNVGNVKLVTATGSGAISTSFTVKTGAIGNGTCATNGTCYVVASELTGANKVTAAIHFGQAASSSAGSSSAAPTSSSHAGSSTAAAAPKSSAAPPAHSASKSAGAHAGKASSKSTKAKSSSAAGVGAVHSSRPAATDPGLAETGPPVKQALVLGALLLYIGCMVLSATRPVRRRH